MYKWQCQHHRCRDGSALAREGINILRGEGGAGGIKGKKGGDKREEAGSNGASNSIPTSFSICACDNRHS